VAVYEFQGYPFYFPYLYANHRQGYKVVKLPEIFPDIVILLTAVERAGSLPTLPCLERRNTCLSAGKNPKKCDDLTRKAGNLLILLSVLCVGSFLKLSGYMRTLLASPQSR
jgi:hypothetical protein